MCTGHKTPSNQCTWCAWIKRSLETKVKSEYWGDDDKGVCVCVKWAHWPRFATLTDKTGLNMGVGGIGAILLNNCMTERHRFVLVSFVRTLTDNLSLRLLSRTQKDLNLLKLWRMTKTSTGSRNILTECFEKQEQVKDQRNSSILPLLT